MQQMLKVSLKILIQKLSDDQLLEAYKHLLNELWFDFYNHHQFLHQA
jgi:hypothetical protein